MIARGGMRFVVFLCLLLGVAVRASLAPAQPPAPFVPPSTNADPWQRVSGTSSSAGSSSPSTTVPTSLAGLIPSIQPPSSVPTASPQPDGKNPDGGKDGNGEKSGKDKKEKNGNGEDKNDEDDKEKDKKNGSRKLLPEGWNFHAQTTLLPGFDAGFGARYSGPNSLSPMAQRVGTITADLLLGAPLWRGAEFHSDLLMWQGFGLSSSFGLENFPNNDAFKSGTIDPRYMMSRFFVRQTIGLGGEQEDVPDGPLTLPGKRDISRVTITAGRLAMPDLFDTTTYNHDGHTQFMSWANTMLSWDYASDTNGYTTGIALEWNEKDWAVRYGWFQMPGTPNGLTADDRIFTWPIEPGERTTDGEFWKQWGMMLELELRWRIEDHPGAIRLQAWSDHGHWVSYKAATALLRANPPPPDTPPGVQATAPLVAFGFHYKYGFGVSWEQEVVKYVGIFGRLGWQDGQTAAAAYNDSNWTAQLGVSFNGTPWRRPGDTFGVCGNLAGASSAQQAYLKAGGLGIQNGDGNLTYAPETSFETYYDFALGRGFRFALDYQFYANPAFNRDRGPVNVFQARLHWEY